MDGLDFHSLHGLCEFSPMFSDIKWHKVNLNMQKTTPAISIWNKLKYRGIHGVRCDGNDAYQKKEITDKTPLEL